MTPEEIRKRRARAYEGRTEAARVAAGEPPTSKPSLKDRRRTEARDALYRAQERRDRLLDALVRNHKHIKALKRTLVRLGWTDPTIISKLPVSVAEGKLLDDETAELAAQMFVELNDDIPDLSGAR